MSYCKHGTDPEQVTCQPCELEYAKSKARLNPSTPAREMTLREHYAGLAMQGLCAGPAANGGFAQYKQLGMESADALLAKMAADIGDALLAELAKPVETPLDERGHPVGEQHE